MLSLLGEEMECHAINQDLQGHDISETVASSWGECGKLFTCLIRTLRSDLKVPCKIYPNFYKMPPEIFLR